MRTKNLCFIFIIMNFIVGCATYGGKTIEDPRYDERYEARQLR